MQTIRALSFAAAAEALRLHGHGQDQDENHVEGMNARQFNHFMAQKIATESSVKDEVL